MRYTCGTCGKFVKDKFLFGLAHVCLSDEEERIINYLRKPQQVPASPEAILQSAYALVERQRPFPTEIQNALATDRSTYFD